MAPVIVSKWGFLALVLWVLKGRNGCRVIIRIETGHSNLVSCFGPRIRVLARYFTSAFASVKYLSQRPHPRAKTWHKIWMTGLNPSSDVHLTLLTWLHWHTFYVRNGIWTRKYLRHSCKCLRHYSEENLRSNYIWCINILLWVYIDVRDGLNLSDKQPDDVAFNKLNSNTDAQSASQMVFCPARMNCIKNNRGEDDKTRLCSEVKKAETWPPSSCLGWIGVAIKFLRRQIRGVQVGDVVLVSYQHG